MTSADPFTRASQTWAPARSTDARRTVGVEERPARRDAGPRALVFGVLSGVVLLGFFGVVLVGVAMIGGIQ